MHMGLSLLYIAILCMGHTQNMLAWATIPRQTFIPGIIFTTAVQTKILGMKLQGHTSD